MDPIEFNSLECRWFLKQAIPPAVQEMFNGVQTMIRTDAYWTKELFEHPFDRTKGIKLREGGFEVKSLLETLNDSIVPGHIQKWCKIRREIPDDIDMSSHWLNLTKKRQLLRFNVSNPRVQVTISTILEEGCNVELTRFGAPFDHHWTFGVEAYGQDQKLTEYLLRTYGFLNSQNDLDKYLNINNSRSYPEWLFEINTGSRHK